jgi:hypothetical protein
MFVPEILLTKTDEVRFQGKVQRILEEGWNYLRDYFGNEEGYYDFLQGLSKEQYEKFLYTIFFFWAHDIRRLIEKEIRNPNIDGFMYQITLSIIEYLNKDVSTLARCRIKDFFARYFSNSNKILENKIIARSLNNTSLPSIETWEILYDMRNEFIHRAKWFSMRREDGFACLSTVKRKDGIKYFTDIRLQSTEYLNLFWKAYLKYFNFEEVREIAGNSGF